MAIEKQIWISMIKEGMIPDTSFLSQSVSMDEHVEYNTINLAEAGVDPRVFIDNNIYPVPVVQRNDTPLQLPLHTFDTESTVVRNVEEKESSYTKMESVVRSHRNALIKDTAAYAAYNWAPAKDGQFNPVFSTSGNINQAGLKAATFQDFLNMRAKFTGMDVDISNVIIVLNSIHESDLMAEDLKLYKTILETGKLFGMNYYTYTGLPRYDTTTGQKTAFGAAAGADDTQCSLIYCKTEVMRASGTTEVFAKYKDPDQRGDVIGFQQRFTALPIRSKYSGAIYSAK